VGETTVGFGQAILEHALEACLGVALTTAAAVFLLEAAVAAAEAIVEEQPRQGEGGGDDGAATEGVQKRSESMMLPPSRGLPLAHDIERAKYCSLTAQWCTVA